MRSNEWCFGVITICLFLLFTLIWLGERWGKTNYQYSPCNVVDGNKRCIRRLPEFPVLTAECPSRLGNQMFSYATLYAISLHNRRTAYMSPLMSNYISKYFKVSLDTLEEDLYIETAWEFRQIGAKVPRWIKHITPEEGNVKFCCYPQAWRYFDEFRPRILNEFRFHDHVIKIAQNELRAARRQFLRLQSNGPSVGVHVRRTDYLSAAKQNGFNLPSTNFYKGAMNYFKSNYFNPIFIVASDDIPWCRQNFDTFAGSEGFLIHYINGTSHEDGGFDLAVLAKCDHVIFGMGTFGFWAGYFSRGEVVYCSDCLSDDSDWIKDPYIFGGNYSNFVLPHWKGMSRNEGGKILTSVESARQHDIEF